ncbi:MAG: hypothetical protein ABFD18_06390 [Syntrophomonas sp.]
MLEQAINKIKTEMDKNKNDSYIQVIGEFLLQQLKVNPVAADKIMAADKTIAKSIDAMATEARKKAKGNRAMLTDAEGYAIVLKYFGIEGPVNVPVAPVTTPQADPVPEKKADVGFNVKLEDLL